MNPATFNDAPWGAPIAVYLVLAGAIAGLPLMAAGLVTNHSQAAVRLRCAVHSSSVALVALASAILVLDLGRPERFFLMISELSLTSPISIGAKLVALDGYLAAVLWFLYARLKPTSVSDATLAGRARAVLGTGELLSLGVNAAIAIYPAFVLGASYHAPLGSLPGGGVVFLFTALMMGTGALMLLESARQLSDGVSSERLATAHQVIVILHVAAVAFTALLAVLGNFGRASEAARSADRLLLLLVTLAVILPIASLLLRQRSRKAGIARALALLFGGAATRWAIFAG